MLKILEPNGSAILMGEVRESPSCTGRRDGLSLCNEYDHAARRVEWAL